MAEGGAQGSTRTLRKHIASSPFSLVLPAGFAARRGHPPHLPRTERVIIIMADDTLDIRIAAVFVVFVAGLIGGIPPLFLKMFKDMTNPIARWLRAASAGIVLSLGFVHILPKGMQQLGNLSAMVPLDPPYNTAGAAVIFGILMMMAVESAVHSFHEGEEDMGEIVEHSSASHDKLEIKSKQVAPAPYDIEDQGHLHKHLEQPHDHKHGGSACLHGSHGHASKPAASYGTIKQKTLAHLFELGCIVHSVIIGIALGIKDSNFPLARNVVIILCFHQLLEGVGLGAMVAIANFHRLKGLFLIFFYSLTAPVGIAIGIGIATTYNPQSVARNATEGVLNSVSAGILIYMGLCQMIAVDFSPESLALLRHWWAKAGMFVSFFFACGCMTMLPVFKNVND